MREADKILTNHTQKVRIISTRLRELIHSTAPNIKEICYPLVHAIGFEVPEIGNICGILPQENSVCLTFKLNEILNNPDRTFNDSEQKSDIDISDYTDIPTDHIRKILIETLESIYEDSMNKNNFHQNTNTTSSNNNAMFNTQLTNHSVLDKHSESPLSPFDTNFKQLS